MLIVADEDILSVDRIFQRFGQLMKCPGRKLTSVELKNADALLVRSITRVDKELLHDTSVSFVGSATSGVDHVDIEYLRARGICFSHAKGSNANAVVEYCFTALSMLNRLHDINFSGKTIALIGAGFVGSLFADKLSRCGFKCLICDPFLSEERMHELECGGCTMVSLNDALRADVISLHVPLTRSGDHPTFHLLNQERLQNLSSGAVLINTSRGEVVDNSALAQVIAGGKKLYTVLDVWENEPAINLDLLSKVTIASPHIAGYSIEAKHRATLKLMHDFCSYYSIPDKLVRCDTEPERLVLPSLSVPKDSVSIDEFGSEIVGAAFPLLDIDRQFKRECLSALGTPVEIFDRMRKKLASRHEFSAYSIESNKLNSRHVLSLSILGFGS